MHALKISQKELHKLSFSLLWCCLQGPDIRSWGEEDMIYILMASNTKLNLKLALNSTIHFQ